MESHKKLTKVTINTLSHAEEIHFNFNISKEDLELKDDTYSYCNSLVARGKYYNVNDFLIIYFSLDFTVKRSCNICNEEIKLPIKITNHYLTELIEEIKTDPFDLREPIRQYAVEEIPQIVECNDGNCPNRSLIEKYIKK